jgi:hypothetical protein
MSSSPSDARERGRGSVLTGAVATWAVGLVAGAVLAGAAAPAAGCCSTAWKVCGTATADGAASASFEVALNTSVAPCLSPIGATVVVSAGQGAEEVCEALRAGLDALGCRSRALPHWRRAPAGLSGASLCAFTCLDLGSGCRVLADRKDCAPDRVDGLNECGCADCQAESSSAPAGITITVFDMPTTP